MVRLLHCRHRCDLRPLVNQCGEAIQRLVLYLRFIRKLLRHIRLVRRFLHRLFLLFVLKCLQLVQLRFLLHGLRLLVIIIVLVLVAGTLEDILAIERLLGIKRFLITVWLLERVQLL